MRQTSVMILLISLSSMACRNAESSPNTPDPTEGFTEEDFAAYRAYSAAACNYAERCAAERGRAGSSRARCEATGLAELNFISGADRFATENLAACVSAFESLSCSATTEPIACQSARRRDDAGVEGDRCARNAQCRVGLHCEFAGDCGLCTPDVSEGGACIGHFACVRGLRCIDGTCRPPAGRDEPCANTACLGNLTCAGTSSARVCVERRGLGRSCEGDNDCYFDLLCVGPQGATTCQAMLADGVACTRTSKPWCLQACMFSGPNAAIGMCAPLERLPPAGQPCSYARRSPLCASSAYADETRIDGEPAICVCADLQPTGSNCSSYAQCQSGTCRDNVCSPKQPIGEICEFGSECESGRCVVTQTAAECAPPLCN